MNKQHSKRQSELVLEQLRLYKKQNRSERFQLWWICDRLALKNTTWCSQVKSYVFCDKETMCRQVEDAMLEGELLRRKAIEVGRCVEHCFRFGIFCSWKKGRLKRLKRLISFKIPSNKA